MTAFNIRYSILMKFFVFCDFYDTVFMCFQKLSARKVHLSDLFLRTAQILRRNTLYTWDACKE